MKWINRLVAVVVVLLTLNIFIQPDFVKSIGKRVNNAVDLPAMLKTEIDKTATHVKNAGTTQTNSGGTPIESIVQGRKLSNKYYYHFASGVPEQAKKVFLQAVDKYNETGIVKLMPLSGQTKSQSNEITFYVYHKRVETGSGAVELGLGGPKIYPWVGSHNYDLNRGKAGLNAEYPQSSMQLSVTMHEIGHVLGLDHSMKRSSIMFPVDQGRTSFSKEDLATLRKIYQ
ncbi:matrixin family metalloprotease [Lentilactobacillus hilgardii]|uniref:matrixin family metalloprotease n=1 Tax=Lentilactobacillus hilgardii TaxID=1588 RepID=UPI0021A47F89|nr:matrixin family metalloprotease [Lentilactobacillus hilgardii]MCT3399247.1 peptidase [Lentilactobacillus hilgardii]